MFFVEQNENAQDRIKSEIVAKRHTDFSINYKTLLYQTIIELMQFATDCNKLHLLKSHQHRLPAGATPPRHTFKVSRFYVIASLV